MSYEERVQYALDLVDMHLREENPDRTPARRAAPWLLELEGLTDCIRKARLRSGETFIET
jgi:hypothetical protein